MHTTRIRARVWGHHDSASELVKHGLSVRTLSPKRVWYNHS